MKIFNRKYNREYEKLEEFEAGIVLTGPEVKSVRAGGLRIDDAFIKILGEEAYLVNAEIPQYQFARVEGYEPQRSRKILLHKKELERIKIKLLSGGNLTVIPVSCYNKGPMIKLEIALSKGRRETQKRKLEKQRDVRLQQKREAKEYMKS